MTEDFLAFTAEQGNDLSTPRPALPRPQARRPLVPLRRPLGGGPARRCRSARRPRSHPRARARHRRVRRSPRARRRLILPSPFAPLSPQVPPWPTPRNLPIVNPTRPLLPRSRRKTKGVRRTSWPRIREPRPPKAGVGVRIAEADRGCARTCERCGGRGNLRAGGRAGVQGADQARPARFGRRCVTSAGRADAFRESPSTGQGRGEGPGQAKAGASPRNSAKSKSKPSPSRVQASPRIDR